MLMIQPVSHAVIQLGTYTDQHRAVPASHYTFDELAEIYNQTRVDYIVPMPMNARRMREYVEHYDIDLETSAISFYGDEATGLIMLGLRDQRAWVTRLGVIPDARKRRMGSFLMDTLLYQARLHGATQVQLEVIQGNVPAHRLFTKYGFEDTRELLVIRRPPGIPQMPPPLPNAKIVNLDEAGIAACLEKRPAGASWVEETASLVNAGCLQGYQLELPTGESGWLVFHSKLFQIAHIVFDATSDASSDIILTLLHHLHTVNPSKDTKTENVPVDHLAWALYQQMGYVESFRRIEMILKHLPE
jgi:ribosomal protein S18 acetylase RimI-like enzyme